MTPQQQQEQQKKAARAFVARWQAAEGSEQAESAKFWLELFTDVLGVAGATRLLDFERKVKGRRIDVFHEDVGVLIEHKSRGVDLDTPEPRGKDKSGAPRLVTPFEQAKWYADNITPRSIAPRWLITCNFDELRIYDLDDENAEQHPETILLAQLPDLLPRLTFLTRKENSRLEREKQLSVAAGEVVGRLYDALAKSYLHLESDPQEQQSLNILMTRIVFLLYTEDAGLLHQPNAFYTYLRDFNAEQTAAALRDLFAILKTPEHQRAPYTSPALARFPYINGGLIEQSITIPQFSEAARTLLLQEASARFDWSGISPTIFGAVFESTLNPATRRAGGMHYTSIENIHKLIAPLFLDELQGELRDIEGEKTDAKRRFRLGAFRKKLASLRFLDPACGSGNFLTETYLCLRKLENRVLQNMYGAQMAFAEADPVQVSIQQFYGVEINDFAVEVAKTALWIAELQMLGATREILDMWIEPLPLKDNSNIHCANALRINWNDVLHAEQCSYVIGNPPFIGHNVRSDAQKDDMNHVFGSYKTGKSDYVICWFYLTAKYLSNSNGRAALVATNSICQGENVSILWQLVFSLGFHIDFAWRTFVWNNEAADQAHVHVIIVGFSKVSDIHKIIYSAEGVRILCSNINGYLLDGPNVYTERRTNPISDEPKIKVGSLPRSSAFTVTTEEKLIFIRDNPLSGKWIKPYIGAEEFLNGGERYCLWLRDAGDDEIAQCPMVQKRVDKVRADRLASPAATTRRAAATPKLFAVDAQPNSNYLLVPQVSSERRKYIPIGFMTPDIIASNLVFVTPDADIYHFGILSSQFHNAWMRIVAGRLKSDYRYGGDLVYNNFIWPNPNDAQKQRIEHCAQAVLDARAAHPGATLAQLYDPDKMPANLRDAHHTLDAAVEAAYGVDFAGNEERITAHLFQLYAQATAKVPRQHRRHVQHRSCGAGNCAQYGQCDTAGGQHGLRVALGGAAWLCAG